jgi:hypothetical protein
MQDFAVPQQAQHVVEGLLGLANPVLAIEHQPGFGKRGDHQAVPVGQHLVVEAGRDAGTAALEQLSGGPRPGGPPPRRSEGPGATAG